MFRRKWIFALFLVFIMACSSDGTKIYKVDYKGNYPEGTFKAVIGNETVFTNGHDILELEIEKNPDFFCYAVNNEVLCDFNIDVKVSEATSKKFKEITQNLKITTIKLEKNRTVLSKRFNYYLNDEKLESEGLIIGSGLQDKQVDIFSVPIKGKGETEEESQQNALKKSEEIINILTDKK